MKNKCLAKKTLKVLSNAKQNLNANCVDHIRGSGIVNRMYYYFQYPHSSIILLHHSRITISIRVSDIK
jgi:hypothetical protein